MMTGRKEGRKKGKFGVSLLDGVRNQGQTMVLIEMKGLDLESIVCGKLKYLNFTNLS